EHSRPVGVRAGLRSLDLARLAAREGYAIERRHAARLGSLEDDVAPARAPARPFVAGAGGEQLLAASVGCDHADAEALGTAAGEGAGARGCATVGVGGGGGVSRAGWPSASGKRAGAGAGPGGGSFGPARLTSLVSRGSMISARAPTRSRISKMRARVSSIFG